MAEPPFNQQLLANGAKVQQYTGEEQNLLLGDKKARLSESRKDSITTDSGVLSVPNEDPENKCRKCCWCMCCLPYYMFCCCLCWKEKEFASAKPDFIKRFDKWIPDKYKLGNHQSVSKQLWNRDKDPIPILILLYSNNPDAVAQLSQCRINPDSSAPVRKDLEFFIPQLCSFYLQGYYDNMQQLVDLIIQASECDFYFSHRIYFFFKSVMFDKITDRVKEQAQRQAVELVLKSMYRMVSDDVAKQVQRQVGHMTVSNESGEVIGDDDKYTEKLFLSNSKDLVRLIVNYNMDFFYPQLQGCKYVNQIRFGGGLTTDETKIKQEALKAQILNWQEQRLVRVQKVFDEYNEQGWNTQKTLEGINSSLNSDDDESDAQNLKIMPSQLQAYKQAFKNNKISARDIVLPPFREEFDEDQPTTNRYKSHMDEKSPTIREDKVDEIEEETKDTKEKTEEQAREQHRKEVGEVASNIYDSYLSTPNFLKRLCEIADSLIGIDNKKQVLNEGLRSLNKQLPGAVYLPFVNQSMRNYAVLHIVAEETRIFKTKERCPLLLCIEVFRPTEISLEKIPDVVTMKNQLEESGREHGETMQSEFDTAKDFLNDSAVSSLKDKYIKKKQNKNTTHTKSFQNQVEPLKPEDNQLEYPFDNFDAYERLGGGTMKRPKQRPNSFKKERNSITSVGSRHSSGSFVSAADSMNDAKFDRLEWELRMKADRKNKKRFNDLRKITNKDLQSDEFGQLVDLRQSDPVKVKMVLQSNKKKELTKKEKSQIRRTSTLEKLNIDYFYKNFAAEDQEQILEDSDEDKSDQDDLEDQYRPGRQTQPKNSRSSRSRSATARIVSSRSSKNIDQEGETPDDEDPNNQTSFSGMNQVGRLSMASRGELRTDSNVSGDLTNNSQLDELTPEQQKLIAVPGPKSAGNMTPGADQGGVDFFKNRDNYEIFLETSKEQRTRVKKNSPFSNLKTWKLLKVIMKTNDDLRQEAFTMQCISTMDQIFKQAKLPLWLKPYEILALGPRCGMLEVIEDFADISSIKEKLGTKDRYATLVDYFNQQFGKKGSKKHKQAIENFTNSLAGYSLVCYILQIKDRHNENIMVNIEGFVCHIDFGFLLSNAPGKGVKFETAPYKLTQEMVDVMGGAGSNKFRDFRTRMARGFCALQENAEKLIILVEMMLMGQSDLPCFVGGRPLIRDLKNRIFPTGKRMTFEESQRHIDMLTAESLNNWRTRCYDNFQYCAQGIL